MATARELDFGRYELLLELARGGMAELFLARLHGAGGFAKLVVVKRILPHLAQDKQFTQMFIDEGRIAARLSHPNVCQVFELGDSDGQLFLTMEYLEGAPLDQLIAASPNRRPDPRLVAGILAQAAEGLHYAHTLRDHGGRATPVVHRDVSPQNLFVTVDGMCKVLDFGVSKMTTDPSRTNSGVIKGKLPYMPPEQIRGNALDGRADVFALGVCAWEALAGERLFDRPSDYLTWQAIVEEPVPSLAARWPACPPAVEAIVLRALARTPEDRQPSAQAFADELRGALGFASAAEIGTVIRTLFGAKLAARSQQVAQALAARDPETSLAGVTAPAMPRGDAGATLEALPASTPSLSMELREHSAVLERPTMPSRPVAPPTGGAIGGFGGMTPPVQPSAIAPPVYPATSAAPEKKASSLAAIVIIALIAAALAVVITVLALRSNSDAPIDAAVVVTPDASSEHFGLDRLDELRKLDKLKDLGKLRRGLEDLRDELHGDKPTHSEEAADSGRLKLTAEPEAKIFEGDTELGATPLDIQLPAGTHKLRAVYGDGREREATVEIRAGRTTREKLTTW